MNDMKKNDLLTKRIVSLATALMLALTLSLGTFPAFAANTNSPATGQTGDSGEVIMISLCDSRTFEINVPVTLTVAEAEAAAGSIVWSLDYDASKEYVDPALYPNHTQGGPLDEWKLRDGSTGFFKDVKTEVKSNGGQTYLVATFTNEYYYDLYANLPSNLRGYQINGGAYLDVSGWYNLTATAADGTVLGSVGNVKIAPYDDFHTMQEIYDSLDELVSFAQANTDIYVAQESMGMSQGDHGLASLDMPYLIIAKSKDAVDNWKKLKAEAEADPTAVLEKLENGTLGNYQVPVLYSNIHSNEVAAPDGVLKFAWMLVDAAAGDGSIDYKTLTGFTAEGEAKLAEQLGPQGAEGSIAIPDLVAESSTYLGFLKGQVGEDGGLGDGTAKDGAVSINDVSTKVDLERYYTVETITVDIDELLDDVIFLIVPEENVEGRTYITRTSSGGFDLNRDNSFQTQAETQNMTQFIAQWNPVSFTEFHGQIRQFQCEPCDPPHEPNFEYDLLAEHLMGGGEALGIAAVANNPVFNSYVIPQRDYLSYTGEKNEDGSDQTIWSDPWDDMSTSYTPQYSMLHGTVAYTVELPSHNDDAVDLVVYGQLGQSKYVADNKDSYFSAQLQIFERGVTNANSNAYELVGQWFCDVYDVEGAEAETFRPVYDGEGQNGNFYPECYIIPLDGENQSNLQAAKEMVEYLTRNGVTVGITSKSVSYGGVEYPAGTAIVSMYQAKRSVANGVLYDGTVITGWPVLYSEGITAFNKTRGFDMAVCAEPAAYQVIAAAVDETAEMAVESSFTGMTGEKVILANTSEAAVSAVNALLKDGKAVSLIISGENKGSFICDYTDFQTLSDAYLISGTGVAESDAPLSLAITAAPVVYISGKPADDSIGFVKSTLVSGAYQYNYDRQAMELMGFQTTEDSAEATLVIGAAALDTAALMAIKNGTAYIGYGSNAINSVIKNLFPDGGLSRSTVSSSSMDALAYVTYPADSLVTASYVAEGDDILYGYGTGYFDTIPTSSEVLVQLDSSKDLLEGFLVATGAHYDDFLSDSIQAISYQQNGMDLTLFANTLTNKVHQRDEFGFIANAAFSALLGDIATGSIETAEDAKALAAAKYNDVKSSDWYAEAVGQATFQNLFQGNDQGGFAPGSVTTRAVLVTVLHRLASEPKAAQSNFADVNTSAWYAEAVNWAVEAGVTNGTGNGFSPNAALTREQAVTMLFRYAGGEADEGNLAGYPDADDISDFARAAMAWAVENSILTGTDAGTLAPQGTATRAQLVTMILRLAAIQD